MINKEKLVSFFLSSIIIFVFLFFPICYELHKVHVDYICSISVSIFLIFVHLINRWDKV